MKDIVVDIEELDAMMASIRANASAQNPLPAGAKARRVSVLGNIRADTAASFSGAAVTPADDGSTGGGGGGGDVVASGPSTVFPQQSTKRKVPPKRSSFVAAGTMGSQMFGLGFKHCYLNTTTTADVRIKMTVIGDETMYAMQIKIDQDNAHSHQLLVSDAKGRIVHVTESLASRLGTTASKLQAGNTAHALDVLLPQPFVKPHIHHARNAKAGDVIPPWSCRSGLSVLLNANTYDGPSLVPFSLDFRRYVSWQSVNGHGLVMFASTPVLVWL